MATVNFTSQASYSVRFEWGEQALCALADTSTVTVIVDVLSFSTCVDLACSRGASVFPYPYKDDTAIAYASDKGALVAKRRSEEGLSLSPASMLSIDRGTRLVLPSPNGSTLSLKAKSRLIVVGCFRNAAAVAEFVAKQAGSVAVVAAGERWADGSLRPAIEDLLCAGAIIQHLPGIWSPEAIVAVAAFSGVRERLSDVVSHCASAVELQERGFGRDVELALDINASRCVPKLVEGAYVANDSQG